MDEAPTTGQRGDDWTPFEIEATVAAYEEMVLMQVSGQAYSKADVVRSLMRLMPARSRGAVELKLQNVTAIRQELRLPLIDGYKRMAHYQRALRDVVVSRARAATRIAESLADYGEAAIVAAHSTPRATSDVLVPPPSALGRTRRQRSSVSLTGSRLDARHDLQRRRLGAAGEEWVMNLEREQLARSDNPQLANLVRWVAREDGDGLGYDIQSFRPTGAPRLIEVKTTNYGPLTPFHITRWEVDVSRQHAESYSLFRVHGFARDPRTTCSTAPWTRRPRSSPASSSGYRVSRRSPGARRASIRWARALGCGCDSPATLRPRVVELFAGVGGFRLGLERSGWEVVWANQWEPATRTQHAFDCYVERVSDR